MKTSNVQRLSALIRSQGSCLSWRNVESPAHLSHLEQSLDIYLWCRYSTVTLCYLYHKTKFKHVGLLPVSYKLGLALAYIEISADCRSIEIHVDVRLSDVILCMLKGFQKSILEVLPIGAWSSRYRLFWSGICFLQELPDSVNILLSIW